MKGFKGLLMLLFFALTVKGQDATKEKNSFVSYGKPITAENAADTAEMTAIYKNMTTTDTLQTKFKATVKAVCKAKGCWMKLAMANGEEVMVRFKDYGFFVPKVIEGKELIVNGLAFVEEMSVADQKHYAKDAGASNEVLGKIVKTKKTLGFEADGVLLKQ